ncbi:EpsG-like putative glucosyltransferase [Halospina denitrificans]|uniref:EpsG-like putative glucosyltransferase n=1 Tax=Halospina denitrificans TaxID=332522 RepID=A0A4R7JZP1_9GAMM|nr:EpsG family protein [Halospina denitrificans]TDT43444.1 EpsG-like putative glucosyltransferase [Halospina denitrificans]
MLPYWLFFLIPAGVIFANQRLTERSQVWAWALIWLFFSLAIGLRFQVGGDWDAYIRILESQAVKSLWEVVAGGDPGYYLLNWLVVQAGGSIYWVNTACGMIVMAGVVRFARSQPLPWLALLVAVPYLIIVVGMGYTRQSAALGFLLIGLVSLGNGKMAWFVFWVMLGATFHKSAVLMLPVAALASTSNRVWSLLWVGLMSLVGGYLFVFDSAERLWTHYVEADYQSQGGLIRVLMNVVPALLFFVFQRYLRLSEAERRLWFWMSLLALVCIPLVVISSTATDRVALYLIPIQMFVFARLPYVVSDPRHRALVTFGVVGYYALVQAVWLFFAGHSYAWLPYRIVLAV